MPTLIGQSGPLAGRRFELDGDVVLGRENAAITLADEETSRRHAEIRVAAGAVVIEDLGSTNGTYVDGRRIDAATDLRGGETIKMGQSTFTLEVEVAPEPVPAPEPDRGATRIVARPEPAADPDATAMRERPPAPPAEPIADPDVTALRPRPPAPPPEPVIDPGHTQLRPRPPKRPPAPEPVGDAPDRTALRPRPPAREPAPAASAPPPAAPAPAPKRAAAGVAAAADQPFGTFAPAGSKRRRGVASRKVTPALVSMATIITTAAALVAYFAGR